MDYIDYNIVPAPAMRERMKYLHQWLEKEAQQKGPGFHYCPVCGEVKGQYQWETNPEGKNGPCDSCVRNGYVFGDIWTKTGQSNG